jgi:hypothetical protein
MARVKPETRDVAPETGAEAEFPADPREATAETEPADAPDESPPESASADHRPDDVPAEIASGIYVYVGPTIHGRIQSGTVFEGGKAQALALCAEAIARFPGVERLIVPAERLAETRENIRLKKGLAYRVYKDLAAGPSK